MTREYTIKIAGKIADVSERLAARRKDTNEAQKNMWFKNLFGFNKISPKVNNETTQNKTQNKPTKNKWLNPEDSFGKLKRGTE